MSERVATIRDLLALARSIAHMQSAMDLIRPPPGHPGAQAFSDAMVSSTKSLATLLENLEERTKNDGP